MPRHKPYLKWFKEVTNKDVPLVGGKNASLGEMIQKVNVPIPPGFAVTSEAYRHYIKENRLQSFIRKNLKNLDTHNTRDLARRGKKIRQAIRGGEMPEDLKEEINSYYRKLCKKAGKKHVRVAVRSSATAEDLPDASFAGQQETYLNVRGKEDLIESVKNCFASLFTNRAISYRVDKGFSHFKVFLSVGVQQMVNSKAAGVAFTIEPESGFENLVHINGSWGLGELVVQGEVIPDQYLVFKPTNSIIEKKISDKRIEMVKTSKGNKKKKVPKTRREKPVLTEEEIKDLAKYCLDIEEHYGRPMDIEWAKDKKGLYILQARPETVHSVKERGVIESYKLKEESDVLLRGDAIGRKIASGKVRVIESAEGMHNFNPGEVLVTGMTDPDWEPIMKIASAIITNKGGRTSHCAIVSRELGIPAIVGTVNASKKLKTGDKVTVDCTADRGRVWKGELEFEVKKKKVKQVPDTRTKVLMNVGAPEQVFDLASMPVDGVGLARIEFIIATHIGEHPLEAIKNNRGHIYVDKLAQGVGKIAAAFYPREVIVRFSDFKSNEYANLKGGKDFEPQEENPMLGWRGASRYTDDKFQEAFRLECRAMKKVRKEMGLKNLSLMIPFCRTVEEAKQVLKTMREEGLRRGKYLDIYVMAEVPSNIVLADKFSKHFDGFSIGSNDLTQLTLGLDRDSELVADIYDERDESVKRLIQVLLRTAKEYKKKVGICGQAPSDFPKFVEFLVEQGIDSISVNPDVALETKLQVAKLEKK